MFTQNEIDKANNVDLLALAESKGYTISPHSQNQYKVSGFGGLYISTDKNHFYSFSEEKGGGAIQFLMLTENKSWKEAVSELIGKENSYPGSKSFQKKKQMKENEKSKAKEPFVAPEKNKNFKQVIGYLLKKRQLDKEVVYYYINRRKNCYQDKENRLIFLFTDKDDNIGGGSFRSTLNKFRGCLENSDKRFCFHKAGTGNSVYVFESAIDLMSFQSILYRTDRKQYNMHLLQDHFISLEGLSYLPLEHYLKQHQEVKQIFFCLDNDEAGINATNRLMKTFARKGYKTSYMKPSIGKDWNEYLGVLRKIDVKKEAQAKKKEPLELKEKTEEQKKVEKQVEQAKKLGVLKEKDSLEDDWDLEE